MSVRLACLYWASRKINAAADADDLVKVRKLVNGGSNGLDDAKVHLARAKKILL
jgi:putative chitinase